ncbi:hypothetical protein COV82_01695 [Candidatus Peregrinibacteria bacterium CG11_big_fil_rev_8_21_14_0_20_46_8]|nr:MAG: hypothetical protein COV82_01695 [Candidatus Peregrinibacteria bacterium CG11_big_fil_rev_8_21_14_0_20_46_8]
MEIVIFTLIVVAGFIGFELFVRRRRRLSRGEQALVLENWLRLSAKVETDPAQSIIEADKLLAYVLRKKGYVGTLGEMMKKARPLFSDNNGIWRAHKLRNRIAHEVDHEVRPREAMQALSSFKRALCDLGIQIRGDSYWV